MNKPVWTPTLKWHLKAVGILLAGCVVLFFALKYATSRLPAPYQKHIPAEGTTPWLNK